MRDLILLSGPDETSVPHQGARVLLVENGHVINACRFTKDLSDALVETTIIEAFEGKIPPNVDIELLMSVHISLVQPTLAPGQCGIDGVILHRLFKQKPVYVRPSRVLLNTRMDCQVNIFSFIIFCAHLYPFCSHTTKLTYLTTHHVPLFFISKQHLDKAYAGTSSIMDDAGTSSIGVRSSGMGDAGTCSSITSCTGAGRLNGFLLHIFLSC